MKPFPFRVTSLLAVLALLAAQALQTASAQEPGLRSGNRVTLKLAGVPQKDEMSVSGIYTVDPDGTISLPYLPTPVRAAGKTRHEVARSIESAFRSAGIYTRPRVIIDFDIGEATVRTVTVSGEVRQPRPVPFRDNMTIWDGIVSAGGLTEFGNIKKVLLTRKGKTVEHDLRKASARVGIKILPDDTIYVKARSF